MNPSDIKLGDEFKMGLEHMVFYALGAGDSGCFVYPMDLQEPVDTAHLVYGDAVFYILSGGLKSFYLSFQISLRFYNRR
jgi:hypothetical protein